MIISEKQIFELMNCARHIALDNTKGFDLREKIAALIHVIESQQSEKLIEIKDE